MERKGQDRRGVERIGEATSLYNLIAPEGEGHKKARLQVLEVLQNMRLIQIDKPRTYWNMPSEAGPRNYEPDIAAHVIFGKKFIVEIDGYSHINRKVKDAIRDEAFSKIGITTIRLPREDIEVLNFEELRNYIVAKLNNAGLL